MYLSKVNSSVLIIIKCLYYFVNFNIWEACALRMGIQLNTHLVCSII
jgi:hypothetical protein